MDGDDIEEHAWKPGEREALLDDTARRAAALAREEMLAWAQEAREARTMATNYPMDGAGRPLRGGAVIEKGSPMSNEWRAHLKSEREILLGAVADVLADERKALHKAESEITTLRSEMSTLREQMAEMRGEIRGRLGADAERQTTTPWPIKAIG